MSQRQPHSALALSPVRSRHILNSIPTVIYVLAITAKGFRSRWASDSVKRILGYEVEEALAPDWWIDCLHPDDKEAAVKKTSILMTHEYRFRSKDGHYLWMQDEASLSRNADGRAQGNCRVLDQHYRTQAGGRTGSASEQARGRNWRGRAASV
jgi:PAS domain S-box-containing protein